MGFPIFSHGNDQRKGIPMSSRTNGPRICGSVQANLSGPKSQQSRWQVGQPRCRNWDMGNHQVAQPGIYIPFGNLTQLWQITMINGKIHYKWSFSIAMLVYQRVYNIIWHYFMIITGIWKDIMSHDYSQMVFIYIYHEIIPLYIILNSYNAGKTML